MLILQIAFWILLGVAGGTILARKGYSPILGICIGVVFGPFGLLAALFMPKTAAGRRIAEQNKEINDELIATRETRSCPKCGRKNAATSAICPRCDYHFA